MGEHKLKKQSKDIRRDTMVQAEVGFYQGWCELMQVAFKKEGMMGVLELAAQIIKRGDEIGCTAEQESPGCTNLHRATVAGFLTLEWFEPVLKVLREAPDGDWYFELSEGGTVDYPKPGQALRTFSESLAIGREVEKGFHDWKRLRESNPLAADELTQMIGAKFVHRAG